ncbi:cytochrome-c oxidase, cbb3-type subunit III [Thiohalorhabdus denitrificans]|uniref:Cbb3-type cytochrome c oxidase subunit n=1 Tax=Thiohalorhabdus denitrificans TaxID=381306 RepID=A0A1G5EH08_9GAMM|nr:cytochrome-c oxidase, cbb3-type subunit III [Thiohalorhabdus denitrificans]SCY26269.1 cytochrome c oxidase cbb3-type subunit 3 [Thiohalorhabdus denitrificans]
MASNEKHQVQTTGHTWDGDLAEYNNPLPQWWVWVFYATVVFAVVYWVLYPAWPMGGSYTQGVLDYSKRAKLQEATSEATLREQYPERFDALNKIAEMSPAAIAKDEDLMNFVNSSGKVLFGDNCSACHGAGGQGVVGHYPNLADSDWLYGGTHSDIRQTLINGRNGYMPAHEDKLSDQEIEAVATYVGDLAGEDWAQDPQKIEQGEEIFHGDQAACYACHGQDAKGNQTLGAPNLTDAIWFYGGEKETVIETLVQGRQGEMPAWQDRLSESEIKILTAYVHALGGGQ